MPQTTETQQAERFHILITRPVAEGVPTDVRTMFAKPFAEGETLPQMQAAVDGLIELATSFPSPEGHGRRIDVWCNEEGALTSSPEMAPNVIVGSLHQALRGPVLITASTPDGETAGLTDREIEAVSLAHSPFLALPLLMVGDQC